MRSPYSAYAKQAAVTWGVNDGQVGAELVLNLDDDLFGPELLFTLQSCILVLNVVLHVAAVVLAWAVKTSQQLSTAIRILDVATCCVSSFTYLQLL